MDTSAVAIDKLRLSTHRAVAEDKVAELVKSIREIGLLHPIAIDHDCNVLAGAHRVKAFEQLGYKKIPAILISLDAARRDLAQIDENLVRNEGTALERAEALKRRKEIYEQLHPAARAGHAGAEKKHRPANENISFAKDTAAKTGKSDRSVQQYVEVAEKLDPTAREIIRPTEAAEKITELMELVKLSPKDQVKIAKRVVETGAPVAKVVKKEAGDEIDERFTPPDLVEERKKKHGLNFDVASHPKSPAAKLFGKGRFWTKKDDALRRSWRGKRVWCNPPFSRLAEFVKKAFDEVRRGGCPIVDMLMPAVRTEQPFWQEFIEPYRDRRPRAGMRLVTKFLDGRTSFGNPGNPDPEKPSSPEFGCVLVTFEACFTPSTCAKCGCVDDEPCEGGCAWVDTDEQLCTACIEPEEEPAPAKVQAAKKKPSAKKELQRHRSSWMKKLQPSPELAAITGNKPQMRTEIIRKVWTYIKRNGLQDRREKRFVNADATLRAVVRKTRISLFDMTKAVNKHLKEIK